MRVFWERKQRSIERDIEGNENRIAQDAYIGQAVNLDRCRYREVSRYLSRRCRGNARRQLRCRGGIEDQLIRIKNRSSIDPPSIEKLSSIQIQSQQIHQVLRCRQDCDKKKLINFEKPQKFSKPPNPRFQNMKCINEKGLEAYQVKKNLKNLVKSLRTKIGVRLECFWERNREVSRERSMEMRSRSRRGFIQESQ